MMVRYLRILLGLDDAAGDDDDTSSTPDEAETPPEPDNKGGGSPRVDDLNDDLKSMQSQVSDLDNDTEKNDNRIQSLQTDMNQMQDDIEEVEGHIRDLLGVYDALSARVNPLVEGDVDNMPSLSNSDVDSDATDSRFGLKDEGAEATSDGETSMGVDEPETDDTRTLEDLRDDTGMNNTEPEPESRTVEQPPSPTPSVAAGEHHHVRSFPMTYAGEAVAYEWLSMLLELTDTAGALRALSYYHDIGWISADVKKELQRRLSGADESQVADGDAPRLGANDHAESLSYVITLEGLDERQA